MSKIMQVRILATVVLAVVFGSGTMLGLSLGQRGIPDGPGDVASEDATQATNNAAEENEREENRPLIYRIELSEHQTQLADSIWTSVNADWTVWDHDRQRARSQLWNTRFDDEWDAAWDSIDDGEFDPRRRALVQDARSSFKAILSVEQVEEYDRLLEESRRRSRNRNGGGESEGGNAGGSDANTSSDAGGAGNDESDRDSGSTSSHGNDSSGNSSTDGRHRPPFEMDRWDA